MKQRLVLIVLFMGLLSFSGGWLATEEAAPVGHAPQGTEVAGPAGLGSNVLQPGFLEMSVCTVSIQCPNGGSVGCTTNFTGDCWC